MRRWTSRLLSAAQALALVAALWPVGAAVAQRPRVRLDRIECFAYSAATGGYACVDYALQTDDASNRDPVRYPDVTRWVQRTRAAWGGHRGIALVTGDGDHDVGATRLNVAERAYDVRGRLRRPHTLASALAAARAAGYTLPVPERAELTNGTWTAFAGVHVRFDTRFHEGDASAYAIGTVHVRCTAPPSPNAPTEGATRLDVRRGQRAVLHHATDAPTLAITLVEIDGGEGAAGVRTRTLIVRLRDLCR